MPTLKEAILACLGDFPAVVPTNWTRDGSQERGGILYTRISYDVAPDERVWAWLLQPTGDPPIATLKEAGALGAGRGDVTSPLPTDPSQAQDPSTQTPEVVPARAGGQSAERPIAPISIGGKGRTPTQRAEATPISIGGQRPAILALHQHAGQFYVGKAEPAGLGGDANMHYGLELARRGYIVFCPDHLAFEDRRPPEYERIAKPGSLQDRTYEDWLGKSLLIRGSTLQAKYLADMARALDVLIEQPGVDADNLGCIGHSLGGQEAVWLAWYDQRIKAAVSSCGISLMSTVIRDRINHNMAAWVPGMLRVADIDAIAAGIAPRALMLIQGEQDPIFPLDGVHHIGRVAHLAYTDHGQPDRFALTTFPGSHSFPIEMRKAAYHWLDRWLKRPARARRTPEPLW